MPHERAVPLPAQVYERAVAQLPPSSAEKRFWRRYIYLWIKYALYEELEAGDVGRARDVYRAALELIPHRAFTFAKARAEGGLGKKERKIYARLQACVKGALINEDHRREGWVHAGGALAVPAWAGVLPDAPAPQPPGHTSPPAAAARTPAVAVAVAAPAAAVAVAVAVTP